MWDDGEPNNSGDNENCAGLRLARNNKWNDIQCTSRNPYICKRSTGVYIVTSFPRVTAPLDLIF